jgi:hypothetical protein
MCLPTASSLAHCQKRKIRHIFVLKGALGQAEGLACVGNLQRLGTMRQPELSRSIPDEFRELAEKDLNISESQAGRAAADLGLLSVAMRWVTIGVPVVWKR